MRSQRLIQSVFVLLAASVVVFLAVYGIGDPVELLVPPQASAAERAELVRRLGLDLPLWQQYLVFVWNALHGDLGRSFVHGVPAIELILARLPATFELVLLAMTLAIVVGIPLGLVAGLDTESRLSRVDHGRHGAGLFAPQLLEGDDADPRVRGAAGLAADLGARRHGGHPRASRRACSRSTGCATSILPALNLAIPNMALMIRLVAAGTAEAKAQDYVKYARAKGVRPRRIVFRHILRNILIPVVTVVGIEFGSLIAFSTITETVFAWPGMGKLLIDSIYQLDRPVVVAYIMLATFLFVDREPAGGPPLRRARPARAADGRAA